MNPIAHIEFADGELRPVFDDAHGPKCCDPVSAA